VEVNPRFILCYLDILQHLANDKPNTNGTTIHMTSNCSQNLKWFEKYVSIAKVFDNAHVTASYHREYVNDKPKMELFADKLRYLIENGVNTTINMVMVPQWFDMLYDEALYFHNRGINVTLKPQSDPNAKICG